MMKSIDFLNKIIVFVNFCLSLIIFFVGVYLIAFPYWPEITLKLGFTNRNIEKKYAKVLKPSENEYESVEKEQTTQDLIPEVNTIVIPRIGVEATINEGKSPKTLNLGFWRRPNTSTPDMGSNTVITGHRFMYTSGPNTFYHLDKVELNDPVIVFWDQKSYKYQVYDIQEVYPHQIEIEDKTDESIITLYTCTPLWTAQKRLVVRAKLID